MLLLLLLLLLMMMMMMRAQPKSQGKMQITVRGRLGDANYTEG